MRIKAISIWQPWASLIAVGAKKYETRSWATSYRGPLLICASQNRKATRYLARDYPEIVPILVAHGFKSPRDFPFGCALALVDLEDCIKTELFKRDHPAFLSELPLGDFSSGRYAWELGNLRILKSFPVTGRQGLFEVDIPEGLI